MKGKDPFEKLSVTVDRLQERGRCGEAARLALAAALKFPGSRRAAMVLEKALSCTGDYGALKRAYSGLLAAGGACSEHYYSLAMFAKRAGDGPGMREAFERLLNAPGASLPIHRYIALCSLDRYAEAFAAAGELVAGSPAGEPLLSRLWNPWGDRSTSLPEGFLAQRLRKLGEAELPDGLGHYRHFLRGSLLIYMSRPSEALEAFSLLPDLPDRLGWMHFPRGWAALQLRRFDEAREAFGKSALSPVSRIQSLGRLAEVHICLGRRAAGLAFFDKALREAHFSQLPGLHAWKGQMLLFTGRYAEAERELAEGGRLGDDAAWCWRGAALAMAGRLKAALADLDKAVRLFPADLEALVWRGEVLRLSGKYKPAMKELGKVLGKEPLYPWALINRALCRAELGDEAGMSEDLGRVDPEILAFLRGAVPALPGETRRGRERRLLEKACLLAMGDRRNDGYLRPVWMTPAGGRKRAPRR